MVQETKIQTPRLSFKKLKDGVWMNLPKEGLKCGFYGCGG